jgi:hypothetical protein
MRLLSRLGFVPRKTRADARPLTSDVAAVVFGAATYTAIVAALATYSPAPLELLRKLVASASLALCAAFSGKVPCPCMHGSGLPGVIHRSVGKVNSVRFGPLLTVAVMLADGVLVLLVRPDVRVRERRRALHTLLVHL